jgi:hypothetical protein
LKLDLWRSNRLFSDQLTRPLINQLNPLFPSPPLYLFAFLIRIPICTSLASPNARITFNLLRFPRFICFTCSPILDRLLIWLFLLALPLFEGVCLIRSSFVSCSQPSFADIAATFMLFQRCFSSLHPPSYILYLPTSPPSFYLPTFD